MALYSVQGKNVVITGASSGIGKELSACFAQAGAHCFLGCLPAEKKQLAAWAETLQGQYKIRVRIFPLDLSLSDGPEKLHAAIRATGEPIHVLVNNAGIIAYGQFSQLTLELQEKIIQVNVTAYVKLMRLFLPELLAARTGRILNIVSTSAFQPSPYHAVYGAGKSFIQMLSEALGEEIRGTGVLIQTFNPPYTNTPLLQGNGFPKQLWWYRIVGLPSAQTMAKKGFQAFLKGRAVYIPGFINFFAHVLLLRLLPHAWILGISRWALGEVKQKH